MDYILENEYLKVTVTTAGAELKSVVRKTDGVEHIWGADPEVWGSHAPILFPNAGRLKDNVAIVKGKRIENFPGHGFARNMEHSLALQKSDTLVLELTDNEETYAIWPYHFCLISTFTLEGDTLHHTLTVENLDEEKMPFGIGYHPGFALPFDDKHVATDYELRFDSVQSPLCIGCLPKGLFNGKYYYLAKNTKTIPIDEHLFDNDSHCMTGMTAKTLGIYEKDSGRAVVCNIEEFPYVLLWSKPGMPQFVCIEPWMSVPSDENDSGDWNEKHAATVLEPDESWSVTMSTSFIR